MNERARRARPARTRTSRTRSGSTSPATTRPRSTSPRLARRRAAQRLPGRDRRHAAGAAADAARARASSTTATTSSRACRGSTGSRRDTRPRPVTCSSAPAPQGRAARERRARRPFRGRPGRRHAGAPRLRPRPYRRVAPLRLHRPVGEAKVAFFGDRKVAIEPDRTVAISVRRDERVRTRIEAPGELDGPLAAGARVGRASVYVDGRRVRTVRLVTGDAVPKAGLAEVRALARPAADPCWRWWRSEPS